MATRIVKTAAQLNIPVKSSSHFRHFFWRSFNETGEDREAARFKNLESLELMSAEPGLAALSAQMPTSAEN